MQGVGIDENEGIIVSEWRLYERGRWDGGPGGRWNLCNCHYDETIGSATARRAPHVQSGVEWSSASWSWKELTSARDKGPNRHIRRGVFLFSKSEDYNSSLSAASSLPSAPPSGGGAPPAPSPYNLVMIGLEMSSTWKSQRERISVSRTHFLKKRGWMDVRTVGRIQLRGVFTLNVAHFEQCSNWKHRV